MAERADVAAGTGTVDGARADAAGTRRRGRPSGRRPADSGTRAAILANARELFGEQGYDRTTLRQVAAAAKVDPTLISHYYGSKQRLFVAVVDLPVDPSVVVAQVVDGPVEQVGERLARLVVGLLETEEPRRRVLGLIRAATSEPEAAAMLRQRLSEELLGRIAAGIGTDHPELRATLVASQVVGLTMARHVIALEPLATAPGSWVVAAVAPTLQAYLTGPLPPDLPPEP